MHAQCMLPAAAATAKCNPAAAPTHDGHDGLAKVEVGVALPLGLRIVERRALRGDHGPGFGPYLRLELKT